ncbi:MAG: Carboxyl-terminal protease [Parcubacteria group bacterium GW2011_GWD2_38_12]|nr:MAG: Carboxyl-terminal protease [Parcubacteria group bacterium GW2011_GWC2_36_17]KKQ39057.1 MAG: Carboxyl-terminal protease [Candidatus Moranbacteria bacterium GW2011_GWF2_37_7]KKQ43615.1 MAG: Carboxyl-terminal protease [Parcubacteria group bacterium GW2011_GWE2_37_8]KKQ51890.1 MAG: Carboxyl-terminal protease [Parcubacteria group bacterium GW2011_GWD2_38_12]KKQ58670.1 MAG: hypothetical protein US79_C0004G0035 [Parcubacteria group bacterium GW2011_GWC1_38_17]KKQ59427.1 MAG: Carboxyl-terminal
MQSDKSKKIIKIISVLIFAVFLLSLSFGIGVWVGWKKIPSVEKIFSVSNKELSKPKEVDFSLFWDVWKDVEDSYVDKNRINREDMVYGAISGMVKSLGDPYTVFLDPKEAKKFKDDVSGSFEGIGAEIGLRKNIITVISPLKDTPAEKAGLRAGDKILKIGDVITIDMSVEEAVSLIRGPKGTEVILTITRDGFEKAREIRIIRGTIKIPIVEFEMKGSVAYVALYHFTANSSLELKNALRNALNDGAKGMILDLRNNPGGYLDVSIDIASIFLPIGETVVIEDFGNGKRDEYKSYGPGVLKDFPMVVLINEGSASASEILAGALRDVRGVQLIGQKTFGKGSVQELKDLDLGASLKVTIAKWLTPGGYSISEGGLKPDIEIEMTDEDFDEKRDPQLDKAMEIVKNMN